MLTQMQAYIQKMANVSFPAEELWSLGSDFMAIKQEPEGAVHITHGIYTGDDVSFVTKMYHPEVQDDFVNEYLKLYPDYECFAMML